MKLIRQAEVNLKLPMCHSFQKQSEYLGFVLTSGSSTSVSEIVDTTKAAIFPTDRTQIKSFLDACIVYRRLTKDFARHALILNDYLWNYKALERSDSRTDNLDALKPLNS